MYLLGFLQEFLPFTIPSGHSVEIPEEVHSAVYPKVKILNYYFFSKKKKCCRIFRKKSLKNSRGISRNKSAEEIYEIPS